MAQGTCARCGTHACHACWDALDELCADCGARGHGSYRVPWEQAGIRGFFATMRDLVIRPGAFFGRMSRRAGAFRAGELAFVVFFVLAALVFVGAPLARGENAQLGSTVFLLALLIALVVALATAVCVAQGTLLWAMGKFGQDASSWSNALRATACTQSYGLLLTPLIFVHPPPSMLDGLVVLGGFAAVLSFQTYAFGRHLVRGRAPSLVAYGCGLALALAWPVMVSMGVYGLLLLTVGPRPGS